MAGDLLGVSVFLGIEGITEWAQSSTDEGLRKGVLRSSGSYNVSAFAIMPSLWKGLKLTKRQRSNKQNRFISDLSGGSRIKRVYDGSVLGCGLRLMSSLSSLRCG